MPDTLTTIPVTLGEGRDYQILIGAGLLKNTDALLAQHFGERPVLTLCDAGARAHLPSCLEKHLRLLPEGEGTKTLSALEQSLNWILDFAPERKTMLAAFGGGVTGDHTGFAAAITLRGLDYIQIPTTLLAQVDSSVGGKTGINMPHGKNLVGAFHQPKLVLIDIDTLATLSDRHMRAGYAEIVKYAFINDPAFFEWLDENGQAVLARKPDALIHAIATSCRAKAAIVKADEREGNIRALLNFGHTFAHALEAACQYDRRLLHGEAVSIGMCLAFETSARMGLTNDNARAIAHLKKLGLPTRIADIKDFPDTSAQQLIAFMGHDKKISGGKPTFILNRGIGKAFITQDVDMNLIERVLEA